MKMSGKHDGMELAQRLRAALGAKRAVTEKKMMGGVCFLLRRHMLCATAKPGFLFRVGPDHQARALERRGASVMRFAHRASKGFVWVDPDRCDARALRGWIALAERYVKCLPPKKG